MKTRLPLLFLSVLLTGAADVNRDVPELLGLVIGFNGSDAKDRSELRYADDDAVKNARLLEDLGAEYVLLTSLDADSEKLFATGKISPPTGSAVRAAFEELNERADRAHAAGRKAHIFVFYSGHGDVENNEGYIQLADGRLRRSDFREILSTSRADFVHVIIDACKSYFLVFDRGPGGTRTQTASSFFQGPGDAPPNVGLLLSTSAAEDSHEWEAYQSGVFSHEVRSALRGAADLDTNGRISYNEAAAFIYGANQAVPNPRFRPKFFVRAPADESASRSVLVHLTGRKGSRLSVGPGLQTHLFVEDERGIRLADFHPVKEQSVQLLLPESRPLFIREVGTTTEYRANDPGPIVLAQLTPDRSSVQQRGAEHIAFTRLFSLPFSKKTVRAYDNHTTAQRLIPSKDRGAPAWVRPSLGIAGLALTVGGGIFTGLAINESAGVEQATPNRDRLIANDRIDRYNTGAVVMYSVAAASLAAYFIWTLWPEDSAEIQVLGGPR